MWSNWRKQVRNPFTVWSRNRIETMQKGFTIIFEPAEEGGYTAYIPELPGAISEGETVDEAREMVLDAARELIGFRRKPS